MRAKTSIAGLLIVLITLGGIAFGAMAFPTPATVPYRWELEFKPGHLRLYEDPLGGKAYWYFTYTVTNKTGSDQVWAPSFVLFTDAGEILRSGHGVPSRLEGSIRDLLGNPLLETQNEIIGEVLQGREHEKDGLIVWPAARLDANEIVLFVAGISGETARVTNPITGKEVILRKTLRRDYLIRGSASVRGSKPIELAEEEWVLR